MSKIDRQVTPTIVQDIILFVSFTELIRLLNMCLFVFPVFSTMLLNVPSSAWHIVGAYFSSSGNRSVAGDNPDTLGGLPQKGFFLDHRAYPVLMGGDLCSPHSS